MKEPRWPQKNKLTESVILLSLKKEGHSAIVHNVDEPWRPYAMLYKPTAEEQIQHDTRYKKYLNLWKQKVVVANGLREGKIGFNVQ